MTNKFAQNVQVEDTAAYHAWIAAQEVADIAAQEADVAESDARYAAQHRRACEASFHAAHFNPADCE